MSDSIRASIRPDIAVLDDRGARAPGSVAALRRRALANDVSRKRNHRAVPSVHRGHGAGGSSCVSRMRARLSHVEPSVGGHQRRGDSDRGAVLNEDVSGADHPGDGGISARASDAAGP